MLEASLAEQTSLIKQIDPREDQDVVTYFANLRSEFDANDNCSGLGLWVLAPASAHFWQELAAVLQSQLSTIKLKQFMLVVVNANFPQSLQPIFEAPFLNELENLIVSSDSLDEAAQSAARNYIDSNANLQCYEIAGLGEVKKTKLKL